MKARYLCEKPDKEFINTDTDHTDNREYYKFNLSILDTSFGKNPEYTQKIICYKTQDKSKSG